MGRAVVQTGTGGEGNTCVKATSLDQSPVGVLDLVADVHDLHAGLDVALGVFANLPVALGSFAEIVQVIKRKLLLGGQLSVRYSVRVVLARVLLDLAGRVQLLRVLGDDWDRRWAGLDAGRVGLPAAQQPHAGVVLLPRSITLWFLLTLVFVLWFLFLLLFIGIFVVRGFSFGLLDFRLFDLGLLLAFSLGSFLLLLLLPFFGRL